MAIRMRIKEARRNYRYGRKKRGMTQAELSDLTGIPIRQITRYENGHRIPTLEALDLIAEALGELIERLYQVVPGDERIAAPDPIEPPDDLDEQDPVVTW